MRYVPAGLSGVAVVVTASVLLGTPIARADGDNNTLIPNNKRLNDGMVANVYTMQHQAGCTNDVRNNPRLQAAAQQHARDVLNNHALDGDVGSDGSTPQDRANASGFRGQVAETVAINQSIAISGNDLINRWYHDPADFAIMSNCANSQMGVWSENSPDRTVVVALYGQPQQPVNTQGENIPPDPSPDYDASDELEFGIRWLPWILRGVYPPPANPPQ
ncbi:CAP domain-containing protein [Mycobacterium paraintracellulare]|uniref:CAP domain-containing protein n=1 Tax=Mycobacterium paraintracellulare TaxID=1138383 RepID=UPI001928D741|nr:CAP domain-containing protein [Mycobacterium paraintracellulare]BCP14221.1 hypothetical protein MINTM021_11300 [Mycobacterium paraintracellulare]